MRIYIPFLLSLVLLISAAGCANGQPGKGQTPDLSKPPVPTATPKFVPLPLMTMTRPTEEGQRIRVADRKGGAAQRVVIEFLQAVVEEDLVKALGYWDLTQMPRSDLKSIHQLVGGWMGGRLHFVIGETSYGGLVAPHDYRWLDENDPRTNQALVHVQMDGIPGGFSLRKTPAGWLIVGWMEPGDHSAP